MCGRCEYMTTERVPDPLDFAPQFKRGETVFLKSGGPAMAVEKVRCIRDLGCGVWGPPYFDYLCSWQRDDPGDAEGVGSPGLGYFQQAVLTTSDPATTV